jgi:hypothetical protein
MSSLTITNLQKRIEELIEERETYIFVKCWKKLYNKYVGCFNKKDKTLIINHSYNKSFYPYGDDSYMLTDYDWGAQYVQDLIFVKGSWDNWNLQYPICKKLAVDDDPYQGYVYYISLDKDLQNGDEYHYKFYDLAKYDCDESACGCKGGNWIEPNIDDCHEGVYQGGNTGQKMIKNKFGTWNASLIIKPVPVY